MTQYHLPLRSPRGFVAGELVLVRGSYGRAGMHDHARVLVEFGRRQQWVPIEHVARVDCRTCALEIRFGDLCPEHGLLARRQQLSREGVRRSKSGPT